LVDRDRVAAVHLLEQRIAAGGLTAPELVQLRNALAALIVALA